MNLVILIPSYNPPDTLPALCEKIKSLTKARIVVVDDGSPEASRPIFDKLKIQNIDVVKLASNRGKGEALREGLKYILSHHPDTSYITICDDDGQHSPEDVANVASVAQDSQNDVTIGSRQFGSGTPWKSRFGNFFISKLLRLFHGIHLRDSQTGLRCFSRRIIESILAIEGNHFCFEINMLINLHWQNIKINEVPIQTIYFSNNSRTRFNPIVDSLKVALSVFNWPPQNRFLQSDLKFFFVLITLLGIAYYPSFQGEFIGDDVGRIETQLKNFGLDTLMSELGDRPFLTINLWLEYIVLGFSAGMMRVVSLVVLATIGLFIRKIITTFNNHEKRVSNYFYLSLIVVVFCLHPIHTQTITHLVQRGALLSALGSLVATYYLLQFSITNSRLPRLKALLAWLLAILAKSNVILFPLGWLLMLRQMRVSNIWKVLLPFFCISTIPLLFYVLVDYNRQTIANSATNWDYFLTQGSVLLQYLKLILLPVGLKFNHEIVSFPNTSLFPGTVIWLALISIAIAIIVKSRATIALFTFLTCISLIPESSFFIIMHAMFEHRTFLPMLYSCIALALITSSPRKIVTSALIALALIYGGLTFLRTKEVQKFAPWALREMTWTCNYRWMTLHWLDVMLRRKQYENLEAAFFAMPDCVHYQKIIYQELLKMRMEPNQIELSLKKLSLVLNSEFNIEMPERLLINTTVGDIFNESFRNAPVYCSLEEYVSQQLKALFKNKNKFQAIIASYPPIASKCLKTLESSSSMQSLKIRTIMFYYYGIYDPNLGTELLKLPRTQPYQRLIEMYEERTLGKQDVK